MKTANLLAIVASVIMVSGTSAWAKTSASGSKASAQRSVGGRHEKAKKGKGAKARKEKKSDIMDPGQEG